MEKMAESLILDVKDCVDLHLHTGPCLFQRPWDDVEAAILARNYGMKAIVLKDHFESTASRAYHATRQVPGINIFGSIVMNRYVGGLNPTVAETAIGMGAKVVWLPTIDSGKQVDVAGGTSSYEIKGELRGPRAASKVVARLSAKEGLTILKDGNLKEEVKEIVKLTSEYDIVLGSGHLFRDELYELVKFAKSIKHCKLTLTHANSVVFALTDQEIKELSDMGAIPELCATIATRPTYETTEDRVRKLFQICPPKRCVIASDAGMPLVACSPEALRVFAQRLYEKGVKLSDLKTMMIENPSKLLGI